MLKYGIILIEIRRSRHGNKNMTRFEEKLNERNKEIEYQKELDKEADSIRKETLDETGLDYYAAADHLFELDKDKNKLIQNYNKNMADKMMDEFHSFEKHLDEMGGKAFPDDLKF